MIAAVFLFLAGFCAFSPVRAQDTTHAGGSRHLISLSTGFSNHAVRDDIISPLVYAGNQLPVLLAYNYCGTNLRQTVTLFYDQLSLYSSISKASAHIADNLNFLLEYSYDRKVFSFEKLRTDFYLGGGLSCLLNARSFHYLPGTNASSGEPMINLALDASFETKPDRTSSDIFTFHIFVPVVSYDWMNDRYNVTVNETLLNLDPDKDPGWQLLKSGSIVTFDKMFEVQAELSYTKFVAPSVAVRAQYRFMYYSFAEYERLLWARYLNNQILVGLVIQI